MNVNVNTNMRKDENVIYADMESPKLRAISLALFGIVAPTIAQGTAVIPQRVTATAAQIPLPTDIQALKDAVFNMATVQGKLYEGVNGNIGRIDSTTKCASEQQACQTQLANGILASRDVIEALRVRATSLTDSAGLALELSELYTIAPTCFSYVWYLTKYPDVAATGAQLEDKTNRIKSCDENFILAAKHYLQYGREEGRSPSPLFFPDFYCKHYPDVAKTCPAGVALYDWAVEHWGAIGAAEGRQGSPLFSAKYYLAQNPDLQKVIGNDYLLALTHFAHRGLSELRVGSSEATVLISAKFHGLTAEVRREKASLGVLDKVDVGEFLGGLGDLLDLPDTCADAVEDNLTCLKGGFVGCVIDYIQASSVCLKEDLQKAIEKDLGGLPDRLEKEGGLHGWDRDIDKQNAAGERYEREAKSGRVNA